MKIPIFLWLALCPMVGAAETQTKPEQVMVGGRVNHPGAVPFHEGLTVLEAITARGGIHPSGSWGRVLVFRNGKQTRYNLKNDSEKDVKLEAGDLVEIPTVVPVEFAVAPVAAKPPVSVGGMVKKTGKVDFHDGMTVVEAIEASGGPNEFGSLRHVVVTRGGKATRHNFSDDVEKDFKAEPGDTIEIPEKSTCGQ